jgi:hypothetical protein
MSRVYTLLLVTACSFFVSWCGGTVAFANDTDGCNNKCRERVLFKDPNPGIFGSCKLHQLPDCLHCAASNCTPVNPTDDIAGNSHCRTTGTKVKIKWGECTAYCQMLYSDAHTWSTTDTQWTQINFNIYVCTMTS